MRNDKDGLSRNDRLKRVTSVEPFSVIDNGKISLLNQSLKIAEFLRYHNLYNKSEGYFNELFTQLTGLKESYDTSEISIADGEVEASQALLLIFLENLQQTTQQFNIRWEDYPNWYLNDILKVKPLPVIGNKVWLSLEKQDTDNVVVNKGTRFIAKNENEKPLYYALSEDIEILDTTVVKGFQLDFEKDKKRIPESDLDFVTAVRLKELQIQQNKPDTSKYLKTVGVKITSPALLLREGERAVTITFYDENHWENLLIEKSKDIEKFLKEDERSMSSDQYLDWAYKRFFSNMFYLSISTSVGWKSIEKYTVTKGADSSLVLDFVLPEDFPATTGCTIEKHKFNSKYPKLNVHLNFDAWSYPYSWMKEFLLYKVKIETSVSKISNLHIYNELGKIDISKPFAPFGINNEKGSWFAIGNYEMAIKHTKSIDLDIEWRQLPVNKTGLAGYYAEYNKNITNDAFTLQSRFLSDYKWKETPYRSKYYLFATAATNYNQQPLPAAPLVNESTLTGINVEKMPPVQVSEENYEYTLQSRSGFVDFVLDTPEMGFGDVVYRKIFTEQIMKNARKNQEYPTINLPMNPLIERATMNYRAEDIIDLHSGTENNDSAIDSILPIDTLLYFPKNQKKSIPFAVPLEEANLLFALKNIQKGKPLNLFFDFVPVLEETREQNIPQVKWYLGNMRQWQPMTQSFIQKDETRRLSVNGRIKFLLPETIDPSLFDNDGLLWIRAGIEVQKDSIIPRLKTIYLNAAQLELSVNFNEDEKIPFKNIQGELVPEKNIPGLASFRQITPFYEGREKEEKQDVLIRISEHITHQGKAVTPRDYERLALQAFPDIAKAKCFKDHEDKSGNTAYVAIIPYYNGTDYPLASNYMMVKIERYLRKLASAYVSKIKIVNPVYQEIMVRSVIQYNGQYLSEARKKLLVDMINNIIAPWQQNNGLPMFGYAVDLKKIYNAICNELKPEVTIVDFEVIRVEKNKGVFKLHDYEYPNKNKISSISPPKGNIIFVPAKEHIIHIVGRDGTIIETFGIDEMKLGDTFIIK